MSKVAWIGLGVMGFPMAGHLKTRGHHDVVVFNRTRAKAEAWVARFGGRLRPPPPRRQTAPTSSSPASAMMTIFAR